MHSVLNSSACCSTCSKRGTKDAGFGTGRKSATALVALARRQQHTKRHLPRYQHSRPLSAAHAELCRTCGCHNTRRSRGSTPSLAAWSRPRTIVTFVRSVVGTPSSIGAIAVSNAATSLPRGEHSVRSRLRDSALLAVRRYCWQKTVLPSSGNIRPVLRPYTGTREELLNTIIKTYRPFLRK